MHIYIVHQNVDYEWGQIRDVHGTLGKAQSSAEELLNENSYPDPEQWSIQKWEVTLESSTHHETYYMVKENAAIVWKCKYLDEKTNSYVFSEGVVEGEV